MTEMVERVAKALFRSRYTRPEDEAFWPDRLDEIVSGPPFDAKGYETMARAAIEAMKNPPTEIFTYGAGWTNDWNRMIDTALGRDV